MSSFKRTLTKEYWIWCRMRDRCRNENSSDYKYYGGRGITVCERWNDFLNFLADMGRAPIGRSLDRIDNDGNYEPSNCRWATGQEQRRNRADFASNRCKRGHIFAGENLAIRNDGRKVCKACDVIRHRASKQRMQEP